MKGLEFIPVVFQENLQSTVAESYIRKLIQRSKQELQDKQAALDYQSQSLGTMTVCRSEYLQLRRACQAKATELELLAQSVTSLEHWMVSRKRSHLREAQRAYEQADNLWRRQLRQMSKLFSSIVYAVFRI